MTVGMRGNSTMNVAKNHTSHPIYVSLYEKAMPDTLSFAEKGALALECGYNGIEISVDETDARLARVLDPVVKKEILQEIHSSGISVKTMCLSGQRRFPFGSRDAEIREKSHEIICRAIDFSYDAGIRVIQIPGYDVWYEERGKDTEAYFAQGLARVIPYAAAAGVILAFETMENDFMNTSAKAMKYVADIASPYLQIYPDLGNIRNGTDDPISDLQSAKGHIAAVHLKETVEGVFRNMEYGQGRVDFVGCMRELMLQNVGIYNCEFWYDGKTDPAELITRNRQYIEKCFLDAKGEIS
ncbi:MAG: L-ribulose-5-phosphate 3-epimerase [Clostridia bacterium]|nr:L-ribulose-5-phosphate 3-epimerase [Clostridia bacterium]